MSRWHDRLDIVERARAKPPEDRVPRDFGELTWLRHFDDDDLATFIAELRAAVSVAYHDHDLTELGQLARDWRATAQELADPARRDVLLASFSAADFVEAVRPEQAGDRSRGTGPFASRPDQAAGQASRRRTAALMHPSPGPFRDKMV